MRRKGERRSSSLAQVGRTPSICLDFYFASTILYFFSRPADVPSLPIDRSINETNVFPCVMLSHVVRYLKAITRSEDLDRLSEELGRARGDLERRTTDRLASAGPPPSSSLVSAATVPASEAVHGHGIDACGDGRVGVLSAGRSAEGVARGRGGIEAGKASGDAKLESGARAGSTERARREARAAREDAEAADKALQSLRWDAEELAGAWTNERMRLLGEDMLP